MSVIIYVFYIDIIVLETLMNKFVGKINNLWKDK